VRRAEAYIRAHAGEPTALHEVADAARCSVRGLQLGFRRHRDTTPLAAIRRARLDAAREALRSGDAAGTVTDLAHRFGFSNPGRFAQLYKAAFGESPFDALRRDPEPPATARALIRPPPGPLREIFARTVLVLRDPYRTPARSAPAEVAPPIPSPTTSRTPAWTASRPEDLSGADHGQRLHLRLVCNAASMNIRSAGR
jgi:AraC-like DNA-binding protein